MGKAQYPVVIAEFWDKNHIFGQSGTLNRLDLLVEGMKKRDYHWYLVIARSDKPSNYDFNYDIFFYGNYPQTVDSSWGNVFFFSNTKSLNRLSVGVRLFCLWLMLR
ncbi:MAG UNVERIFIED_CONTAM: hypothetical protein LVR29_08345 [Microcystis novacekii LVE1205-3]|jgi:hypothetical protein